MSALQAQAAFAPKQRALRPGGMIAARRTERRDRLIASAVLLALVAGWMLNFVSVKQLSLGFGGILQMVERHA